MYGSMKYNESMHGGRRMSKPGKAISTGQKKMNWTAPVGGAAAGTDSPGKARMRHTMKNRGQGTGMASKGSGRVRIPKTRGGYYPLHGED